VELKENRIYGKGERKKGERETRGKKKIQPVWSALPGCYYLAVYDIQIEGGLGEMKEAAREPVHSRGNHESSSTGS